MLPTLLAYLGQYNSAAIVALVLPQEIETLHDDQE
jgi:hypothetical protein